MKRRTLLKSLGIGALTARSLTGTATAAEASVDQQNSETAELLFVQVAETAELKNGILRLNSVNPSTLYFSDRPQRIVGHERTDDFVAGWGVGEDNFAADPPNAALSILTGTQTQEIVLTLMNPHIEGDDLVYSVKILEGNKEATGAAASLFIDLIGRPMTPVSVAGRRRRTIRRVVR